MPAATLQEYAGGKPCPKCGHARASGAPNPDWQCPGCGIAYLKNRLKSCEEFLHLPEATEHSDPSWFGFPITVKENCPVTRPAGRRRRGERQP